MRAGPGGQHFRRPISRWRFARALSRSSYEDGNVLVDDHLPQALLGIEPAAPRSAHRVQEARPLPPQSGARPAVFVRH